MGDSLPWTPVDYPGKFDAAGFILTGEIRNRSNKQKTHKGVTDIYIHILPIGMCG